MSNIAEKLITIAENQEKVYEAGKQAEYDRFWDACQDNGNRTDYKYGFAYKSWTHNNFKPKYDILPTDADSMFRYSNIQGSLVELLENAGVTIDFGSSTSMGYVFADCPITEVGIIDTRSASDLYRMFWLAEKIESIGKIILKDDGSQTTGIFHRNTALKEIRIEGKIGSDAAFESSRFLSDDSVQSIISSLKDLTGSATQKFTLHATVGAKLTEEQKATITAKNWTLVY